MTTTQGDLHALRTRIKGDVVLPDEEAFATARLAWNLSVDQRPAAVVYPESADDMVEIVRFAGENGLRVAFNGGGHNAGPDQVGRPRAARADVADARGRDRPGGAPGARPGRDPGRRPCDRRRRARARLPRRHLARRGRRRLHARRRHQLGGAQARAGHEQHHRARRGHRRRPARAHRRRERARPLLGAPRRRRQLRRGRRARVRAPRAVGDLRRLLLLADRARDRDPERLAELGRHRARGVHLARPDAQAARPAVHPRPPEGARLRDGRAGVHRQRGRRRGARPAVPRPRARVRHGGDAADRRSSAP